MSYVEHIRLVAKGDLGAPGTAKEHWSCGLNFIPEGGVVTSDWPSVLHGYADDAFDDWAAFITNASSKVSAYCQLREVVGYRIHTDGRAHDDIGRSDKTTSPAGVSSTNLHPWQNALCVTLDAGPPKAGRFGRFYLPPQSFTMSGGSGQVDSGDINSIWSEVITLLTNLSNIPGVDANWKLAVAGQTGGGTLRPVTSIRLGNVCDTVRRRRRQLTESYQIQPFTG